MRFILANNTAKISSIFCLPGTPMLRAQDTSVLSMAGSRGLSCSDPELARWFHAGKQLTGVLGSSNARGPCCLQMASKLMHKE
jgi:hypothetical protein